MNIIAVLRLISLRIAVGKLISVGILGGDSSSVNTCKVLVIISFDTVKTVSVGIGESDYGCSDLILGIVTLCILLNGKRNEAVLCKIRKNLVCYRFFDLILKNAVLCMTVQ